MQNAMPYLIRMSLQLLRWNIWTENRGYETEFLLLGVRITLAWIHHCTSLCKQLFELLPYLLSRRVRAKKTETQRKSPGAFALLFFVDYQFKNALMIRRKTLTKHAYLNASTHILQNTRTTVLGFPVLARDLKLMTILVLFLEKEDSNSTS